MIMDGSNMADILKYQGEWEIRIQYKQINLGVESCIHFARIL